VTAEQQSPIGAAAKREPLIPGFVRLLLDAETVELAP
jgi:hypothetical protein